MSDLLNQASLVFIPSGYKEDTAYSVIPTDGSGDLTFTRASDGTRVNSAGLVEVTPWNLLQYSEEFDNAYWAGSSGVVANSTTAPNGTLTADTNNSAGVYPALPWGGDSTVVNTASIYAKANPSGASTLQLGLNRYGFGDSILCTFNLATGVAGSVSLGGSAVSGTASIESVGNGWYRCILTGVVSTSAGTLSFNPVNNCFIWGAQVNIGSTAKPYFPTTDRLNVPRLTYSGGCPSLLLEKQSTNLQLYSEDLTNAVWPLGDITANANQTTSPDGTINADSIIENTATARHELYSNTISFSGSNAISFFIKANGRQYISVLSGGDPSFGGVTYDVVNGLISATSGGTNATINAMGNGWYKCTFTTTRTGSSQVYWCFRTTGGSPTVETYTGNGTSGFYIWGVQIEPSSYPTSYIPTTSSSATRVADECYKTGISSLIGQTEGTILLDWVQNALNNTQGIYANNYNLTGSISIQIGTDGTLRGYICYGGTYFGILSSANAIQVGQRYKIGFAYKSGDSAFYLNGNLIGTDNTSFAFTTTLDEIDLSNSTVFFANVSEISVNELVQIKTRISNADIQSWTS